MQDQAAIPSEAETSGFQGGCPVDGPSRSRSGARRQTRPSRWTSDCAVAQPWSPIGNCPAHSLAPRQSDPATSRRGAPPCRPEIAQSPLAKLHTQRRREHRSRRISGSWGCGIVGSWPPTMCRSGSVRCGSCGCAETVRPCNSENSSAHGLKQAATAMVEIRKTRRNAHTSVVLWRSVSWSHVTDKAAGTQ